MLQALYESGLVLLKILPIFVIVILFTAVINYFFKPKKIAQHLGKKSGWRGWLLALIAGVISHGPMYAWYPMINDLKEHGLKNSLVAVFFYARSIKIPLLPMMIDYFGLIFTVVLITYTLLASLVQGLLIELLNKRGSRFN
jgi:uncharacterized membrane protein YraQ (UPF0718 family)